MLKYLNYKKNQLEKDKIQLEKIEQSHESSKHEDSGSDQSSEEMQTHEKMISTKTPLDDKLRFSNKWTIPSLEGLQSDMMIKKNTEMTLPVHKHATPDIMVDHVFKFDSSEGHKDTDFTSPSKFISNPARQITSSDSKEEQKFILFKAGSMQNLKNNKVFSSMKSLKGGRPPHSSAITVNPNKSTNDQNMGKKMS